MRALLLLLGVLGFACSAGLGLAWSDVANMIDSWCLNNSIQAGMYVGNAQGLVWTHSTSAAYANTTHMSVASASKMVAASIIYRLVEQSLVNLTDSPARFLDWWTTDPSDPRSNVTLQNLLAFTSGFTVDNNCVANASFTPVSCAQAIYENTTWPNGNFYTPGTSFYYSSNHLQVAQAMVTAATGLTWAQLFQQYYKTPFSASVLTIWTPLANPNLAGGLYTTGSEYEAFLLSMFNNNYFQNSNTRALFFTDNTQGGVNFVYTPVSPISPLQPWHYCQGNWFECQDASFDAACGSANVHSSPGLFGFYPRLDFGNEYWSVVMRQDVITQGAYLQSVELWQYIESNVTLLMKGQSSSSPVSAAPLPSSSVAPTSYSPTSLKPTSASPTSGSPISSAPLSSIPTSASPSSSAPTVVGQTYSPSVFPTSASPSSSVPTSQAPSTSGPTTAQPSTPLSPTSLKPTSMPAPVVTTTPTRQPSVFGGNLKSPTSLPTSAPPSGNSPTTSPPALEKSVIGVAVGVTVGVVALGLAAACWIRTSYARAREDDRLPIVGRQ